MGGEMHEHVIALDVDMIVMKSIELSQLDEELMFSGGCI
jgi:nucleotide-binding universal stress UspA family protein